MYIEKIAYNLNRRDEVPNQELGKELALTKNAKGLDEIAGYLYDKNKSVASDCLKVLYEAGYHDPNMITKYTDDFLRLTRSKNNRMVWGAMIGLWNVAKLEHKKVFKDIDWILKLIETGTLITHVTGIKVLIALSEVDNEYYDRLYPIMINYLDECRPIDFGKRFEDYLVIWNDNNKEDFIKILNKRYPHLNKSQASRIKRALKKIDIKIDTLIETP